MLVPYRSIDFDVIGGTFTPCTSSFVATTNEHFCELPKIVLNGESRLSYIVALIEAITCFASKSARPVKVRDVGWTHVFLQKFGHLIKLIHDTIVGILARK